MSKKCGHCKFSVPDDAIVCGYCGAQFVKFRDTSFFARVWSALLCAGFFYALVYFFTDSHSNIRPFAVLGGLIYGGLFGLNGEHTKR